MEKDSIAKWQRRIEQTFKGPNDIVGERVLNINAIENDLQTYMINKFTGYVTLRNLSTTFGHSLLKITVAVFCTPTSLLGD